MKKYPTYFQIYNVSPGEKGFVIWGNFKNCDFTTDLDYNPHKSIFQMDSNTLRPKELAIAQKGSFLIIIMVMCQVLSDG